MHREKTQGAGRAHTSASCLRGRIAAPYLRNAVRQVLSGSLGLEKLASLPDEELIAALEQVRGIGVRVASCVALSAYGRTACASGDTWIRKLMAAPFPQYGDSAGIMPQRLFCCVLHRDLLRTAGGLSSLAQQKLRKASFQCSRS